jgi:hypothetical protein
VSASSTDDASRSSGSVDLVFRPNRNSLKTVNPKGYGLRQYRAASQLAAVYRLGAAEPLNRAPVSEASHAQGSVDTGSVRHGGGRRYSQCPAKAGSTR